MVETSLNRDFFEEQLSLGEESVLGAFLDKDLSNAHIMEDPLIKNFAEANHFLDHNMTRRRTKLFLNLKFFFKRLFGPKKEKKAKARKAKSKKKTSKRKR